MCDVVLNSQIIFFLLFLLRWWMIQES